jgi:DNA-binding MarR family transcriptional regulator
MAAKKRVQAAHISSQDLNDLHRSMLDMISVLNHPQPDEYMIRAAGVSLERALFPLLVGIERLGPIPLVELAKRAGRDYTTVSRQVSRLEELGLVKREEHTLDRRVRKVAITSRGKAMTNRIDAARERMGRAIFDSWEPAESKAFIASMRKFADALQSRFSARMASKSRQNR